MNILSLKLVILHHFSKNIESLKKNPCCYDNNYSNTSCSKNIVASSIFEARGCCMHVFLVQINKIGRGKQCKQSTWTL